MTWKEERRTPKKTTISVAEVGRVADGATESDGITESTPLFLSKTFCDPMQSGVPSPRPLYLARAKDG